MTGLKMLLVLTAMGGVLAVGAPFAPSPQPAVADLGAGRLLASVLVVGDTLFVDGSLQMPADDGRGPIDSARVRLNGAGDVAPDTTFRPAPPAGTLGLFAFRVYLPPAAGTATYSVFAEAVLWRRGAVSVARSDTVAVTTADVPPPAVVLSPLTVRTVP